MNVSKTTLVNEDELGSKDSIESSFSYRTIDSVTSLFSGNKHTKKIIGLVLIVVLLILIIFALYFSIGAFIEIQKSK